MLSDEVVLEIRRLLDEGNLSWRAIGERIGVSRTMVGHVAKGRRRPKSLVAEGKTQLPSRCRKCGGMVYKPCRLCRVRSYQRVTAQIQRLSKSSPPDRSAPRQAA